MKRLCLLAAALACTAAMADVAAVTVDPDRPARLVRADGRPVQMCGPGDPEGFLYRGVLREDGTRDGDQAELIAKLAPTGANCIYLMAIRSHGGDGDATENPFVDHDPRKPLNPAILEQWDGWFEQTDRAGIVIYFFLYDDGARPWRTGNQVGPSEDAFVRRLADRLKHHANLVWCIAEEYQEAVPKAKASRLAAILKEVDPVHPVAIHKLNGLDFAEFAADPCLDQFAVQYNVATAEELHAGLVQAWRDAAGRYSLNLSESAEWGHGAIARRKAWACAMAGADVMILGMDIASTPLADLEDCGRLVRFMESVHLPKMAPHDELRAGATSYVLAEPDRQYVAWTAAESGDLGVRDMPAGSWQAHWLQCATGRERTDDGVRLPGGTALLPRPDGFSGEVALSLVAEREQG